MNLERPVADPAILKRGRAAEDMPPFIANEKINYTRIILSKNAKSNRGKTAAP